MLKWALCKTGGRIGVFHLSLHVTDMCGCINTLFTLLLVIFDDDGEAYRARFWYAIFLSFVQEVFVWQLLTVQIHKCRIYTTTSELVKKHRLLQLISHREISIGKEKNAKPTQRFMPSLILMNTLLTFLSWSRRNVRKVLRQSNRKCVALSVTQFPSWDCGWRCQDTLWWFLSRENW